MGKWTEWQDCIPSCGPDSKRSKYRRVTTPASFDGDACADTVETESCDAECPEGSCQGGVFKTVADLVSGCAPNHYSRMLHCCCFFVVVSGSFFFICLRANIPSSSTRDVLFKAKLDNCTLVNGSIEMVNLVAGDGDEEAMAGA